MKNNPTITTPFFTLCVFGLFIASRFAQNQILSAGGNIYLTVIILNILIFIIPTVIFCRLKGVGYSKKMNIRLFAPSQFGGIIVSTLFLIFVSALIRYGQVYLFGLESTRYSLFGTYMERLTSESLLPIAMAFAIVPAISEELVFRTIVLTEYNWGGLGAIPASIGSIVLFSAICLNTELLPIYIAVGIVCCMITYATGSSLTAVIVHVLFNCYQIFGEKYVFNAVVNPANKVTALFAIGTLFLAFGAFMFADFERMLRVSSLDGTPTPSYLLKTDDESTPDIMASENKKSGAVSGSLRGFIEIMFSPTMLITVLVFLVFTFGFK